MPRAPASGCCFPCRPDDMSLRSATPAPGRARLALALAALALAACAVAPPQPVETPVPVPAPPPKPIPPPAPAPRAPEPPAKPVQPAPPPEPEAPRMDEETIEALALLSDLQRILADSAEEQRREFAALSQAFAKQRLDTTRVKLAVLHTVPGASFQDDARAMVLLEAVAKGSGSAPVKAVALLVHAQVAERQRQVREEQKKAEALQQKLDALKALERSLIGRDRRAPTK
jgi:hypothetical protein